MIAKFISCFEITIVNLGMPYYRILVWTKLRKLPFKGIRVIDNTNINAVYNLVQSQANSQYRQNLIEIGYRCFQNFVRL